MTLNEYQSQALSTAIYPKDKALEYLTISLAGEVGELCNKIKKVLRGDLTLEAQTEAIIFESGDCLWYIANLANHLGYTLEDITKMNLQKLEKRAKEGKLKGEGDNR